MIRPILALLGCLIATASFAQQDGKTYRIVRRIPLPSEGDGFISLGRMDLAYDIRGNVDTTVVVQVEMDVLEQELGKRIFQAQKDTAITIKEFTGDRPNLVRHRGPTAETLLIDTTLALDPSVVSIAVGQLIRIVDAAGGEDFYVATDVRNGRLVVAPINPKATVAQSGTIEELTAKGLEEPAYLPRLEVDRHKVAYFPDHYPKMVAELAAANQTPADVNREKWAAFQESLANRGLDKRLYEHYNPDYAHCRYVPKYVAEPRWPIGSLDYLTHERDLAIKPYTLTIAAGPQLARQPQWSELMREYAPLITRNAQATNQRIMADNMSLVQSLNPPLPSEVVLAYQKQFAAGVTPQSALAIDFGADLRKKWPAFKYAEFLDLMTADDMSKTKEDLFAEAGDAVPVAFAFWEKEESGKFNESHPTYRALRDLAKEGKIILAASSEAVINFRTAQTMGLLDDLSLAFVNVASAKASATAGAASLDDAPRDRRSQRSGYGGIAREAQQLAGVAHDLGKMTRELAVAMFFAAVERSSSVRTYVWQWLVERRLSAGLAGALQTCIEAARGFPSGELAVCRPGKRFLGDAEFRELAGLIDAVLRNLADRVSAQNHPLRAKFPELEALFMASADADDFSSKAMVSAAAPELLLASRDEAARGMALMYKFATLAKKPLVVIGNEDTLRHCYSAMAIGRRAYEDLSIVHAFGYGALERIQQTITSSRSH